MFESFVDNMPIDCGFPFVVSVVHKADSTISIIGCEIDGLNYIGCDWLDFPVGTPKTFTDEDGEEHEITILIKNN